MPFIVFLTLIFLSIGSGYILLTWSLKSAYDFPFSLRISSAYFIGIAFFVSMTPALYTLLGRADLALWGTLLLSVCLCALFNKSLKPFFYELFKKKSAIYVVAALLLYTPIVWIYWSPEAKDVGGLNHPYAMVGSLHSVRYAWVANYISECISIPILGQNIGQSVLSFMGGEISRKSPFVFLYLWLISTMFFLYIFFYGVISLYENRSGWVLSAVFMIMFGSTALSALYIPVMGSGSPFGLNGYTDTLFSVFSILIFLFFHTELQKKKTKFLPPLVVVILICTANFFMAPQNICYLFACIPVLIWNSRSAIQGMREPILWITALLVSALVALPRGGTLTPKFMQSEIDYAGLMTAYVPTDNTHDAGIGIYPGVPFKFGKVHGSAPFVEKLIKYKDNWRENLEPVIWQLEQSFYTSLRVYFFPIIGLLALWFMSKSKEGSAEFASNIARPSYKTLSALGGYTFIIGFVIAYSIQWNGYKWELSRLMIPGITIGMLGLSLCFLKFLKQQQKFYSYYFVILIFITSAPIVYFINGTVENARSLIERPSTLNDLQVFLGQGPDINKSLCVKAK
jgi:hypothetical protein